MGVALSLDIEGVSLICRDCLSEDAEKFPRFASKIAEETQYTLHYPGKKYPIEKIQQAWRSAFDSSSEFYLGVFNEEELIGQLHFKIPSPNDLRAKHIGKFSIMVIKEYWGTGVSNEMMLKMDQRAKKMGINRIEATVMVENERAIAFYKKLGYLIEGAREKSIHIQGTYHDEYYIAKFIE